MLLIKICTGPANAAWIIWKAINMPMLSSPCITIQPPTSNTDSTPISPRNCGKMVNQALDRPIFCCWLATAARWPDHISKNAPSVPLAFKDSTICKPCMVLPSSLIWSSVAFC